MNRRVGELGMAIGIASALVAGCSQETGAIESTITPGQRCAIDLGKFAIGKFDVPEDATNDSFTIPGISPDNATLTLVTQDGAEGTQKHDKQPARIATFTYGVSMMNGAVVDGRAAGANQRAAGRLSFELQDGQSPIDAVNTVQPGLIGVDEPEQLVASNPYTERRL